MDKNNALIKLDRANQLLMEVSTIQDAKAIIDVASAAEVYAKKAALGEEAENYACSIKIQAKRKLGEMIAEQKRTVGLNKGRAGKGRPGLGGTQAEPPKDPRPTLAEAGISKKLSAEAQKLATIDNDIFEEIKNRELSIVRGISKDRKRKAEADPKNKIIDPIQARILYADPPWEYGSKTLDGYGVAESHYRTMSISKLCTYLEDQKIETTKDAALFLWVTSPLLEDAFKVINAWGFKYKASFIWDKIKHNYGHYNSVRHEILLIATKGSCLPDTPKLIDSVQSIQKTKKHSEKPEEFRKIIDTLYTSGKKLELFGRKKVNGWEVRGDTIE